MYRSSEINTLHTVTVVVPLFARSERSERSAYVFLTWFEIASWSCVTRGGWLVGSIFSEKAETVQNTAD